MSYFVGDAARLPRGAEAVARALGRAARADAARAEATARALRVRRRLLSIFKWIPSSSSSSIDEPRASKALSWRVDLCREIARTGFSPTRPARLPGLPRVGKFTLAANNTLADVPALPGKRALFWPLLQNRTFEVALLLSDVIACSRARISVIAFAVQQCSKRVS